MHNVNGPNISVTILGIKCDNPECVFVDESVKVEDYHLWLNKPCPNCGANLLTQADFNLVKEQLKMAEKINKMKISAEMQKPRVRMYGAYDGSGEVTYSGLEIVNDDI